MSRWRKLLAGRVVVMPSDVITKWHLLCFEARLEVPMAYVASLREHVVEELNDLLNAEHQLIEALPEMQKKASRRELKAAFRSHLAETRGHAKRIEQALKTPLGKAVGEDLRRDEGPSRRG